MNVAYVLDGRAQAHPEVRHALETLSLLHGYRSRFVSDAASLGPEEAPVYVGESAAAEGAAASIEVRGWGRWDPSDLEITEFEGRPLPCPRSMLPLRIGRDRFPAPWLRSVGFLLAREEESIDARRDQWECYAGSYSWQYEVGVLDRPLVNHAAAELGARIEAWCARKGLEA